MAFIVIFIYKVIYYFKDKIFYYYNIKSILLNHYFMYKHVYAYKLFFRMFPLKCTISP